jgi:soluble lytic murein transglycosylase
MERVKTGHPPIGMAPVGTTESRGNPPIWPILRSGLVLTLLASALSTRAATGAENPLCDWFSGIGEAAQALADGRPERSEEAARRALAARPRGTAAARASAALGLALRARGAHAAAADALEVALAPPTAPARAELAYLRGESLLLSGDAPAAARLLGEAARAERLAVARRAGFLGGRALLASDLPSEAVAVLEPLLRLHPADPAAQAARLDLASARLALRDEARAVALLREVWLSADGPEAEAAGERLETWRRSGGPVPAPTAEDHLGRAERLLADGRAEPALREAERAAAEEPAQPELAQALRAGALAGAGRLVEAAQVAEPLSRAEDPSVRRAAELVLARAAARAGRLDEAVERYAAVAASSAPVPGLQPARQRELADEAAYLSAWLPYDAGQYARAAGALEQFGRAHPRSRRAEDAAWFAAWSRFRLGLRAEAVRAMARLSTTPLADAAAYWQARVARGGRQKELLRRAAALGGEGWYGLLARARLGELGEPAARPARPAPRPLPEAVDPRASGAFAVAGELLGLGLEDAALDELRELAASPRARAAAAQLAQLAAFAGDAELPFRMARDHLGPSRRVLRWSHPAPHLELLAPAAAAVGVDRALALAVMRRESSFRRTIRSGAGAEGLLQLRPATAERLASVLGLQPGAGSRLADPAVNVPLGTHYLGLLAGRFRDPAVALAAYNAGPAPVAEWARARAGMALDEWVECVPYRETRQYLKIVLADWDTYRDLLGERPAPIDPSRPVGTPLEGVQF